MTPHTRLRSYVLAAMFVTAAPAGPVRAVSCTVTPQSVNFGPYDSLTRAAVDGVGSVFVNCDGTAGFAVSLGQGGSGTFAPRSMSSGQSDMTYNLYTGSARTTVWGDGSGGTLTVGGSGTSSEFTVHGRIDAGQNLPAGTYTDTVVVTVTY